MNQDILLAAMPNAGARAAVYAPLITAAMDEFRIITSKRQAAFLAQLAHESGSLRYTKELGSMEYLDKYDTGPLAVKLGNTPEDDNDGQKYCGRGLIQLTGKRNYEIYGKLLGLPLLAQPELLELPKDASRSAACFWQNNGLNDLADRDCFGDITKKINGGFNGLDDRIQHWLRIREVLGVRRS